MQEIAECGLGAAVRNASIRNSEVFSACNGFLCSELPLRRDRGDKITVTPNGTRVLHRPPPVGERLQDIAEGDAMRSRRTGRWCKIRSPVKDGKAAAGTENALHLIEDCAMAVELVPDIRQEGNVNAAAVEMRSGRISADRRNIRRHARD